MRTQLHRSGFTLVELMVAMTMAIILAALAVGIVSATGAATSQKVVAAGDKVSGWLMIAKSRAIRDGNVQGVRFFIDGDRVTTAQYIEKPDSLVIPNSPMDPTGARIVFVYEIDTNTPAGLASQRVFYVQGTSSDPAVNPTAASLFDAGGSVDPTNSYLLLPEFHTSYRLTGVGADTTLDYGGTTLQARELILADNPKLAASHSPNASGLPTHTSWGFAFQPPVRPLFGEQTLQLGENTCIDYRPPPSVTTQGVSAQPPSVPQYFDVLFTSSGQVYSPGTQSIIALWVRDPNLTANPFDFANAGEQVLVVVYPRTGSISTCLVNPDPADPHKNAREGINAGL